MISIVYYIQSSALRQGLVPPVITIPSSPVTTVEEQTITEPAGARPVVVGSAKPQVVKV